MNCVNASCGCSFQRLQGGCGVLILEDRRMFFKCFRIWSSCRSCSVSSLKKSHTVNVELTLGIVKHAHRLIVAGRLKSLFACTFVHTIVVTHVLDLVFRFAFHCSSSQGQCVSKPVASYRRASLQTVIQQRFWDSDATKRSCVKIQSETDVSVS